MTVGGELPATLLAAGPGVSSQVFGSALIGLREGLEADPGDLQEEQVTLMRGRMEALIRDLEQTALNGTGEA